jgi:hypothetical protein
VNPIAPPTHEHLAEKLGEISLGLAANGGRDWLSALLISLINLIIEALRAIKPQAEATLAEAGTSEIPSTPRQKSETSVQAKSAPAARPQKSRRQPTPTPRPLRETGRSPRRKARQPLPRLPSPRRSSADRHMKWRHRPAGLPEKSE